MIKTELKRLSYLVNQMPKGKELKYSDALEVLYKAHTEEQMLKHGWEMTRYGPHNKKLEAEIEKHFDIHKKGKLIQSDFVITQPKHKDPVSDKIPKHEKEKLKELLKEVTEKK